MRSDEKMKKRLTISRALFLYKLLARQTRRTGHFW